MTRPHTLSDAVDQAIAAENRRVLADPDAMRAAEQEGDRIRQQLVRDGMTWLAMPGDPLPDGTVAP